MSKYTQQQLEAQYDKLPPDLKTALYSVDIANRMFEIGKKHTLTIEETGLIAEETGLIVLGLEKPQNLSQNVQSRLNIDEDEAQPIAHDINEQVFLPLREALKKAHNIEIEASIQKQELSKTTSVPPAAATQRPTAEIKPKAIDIPSAAPGAFPQPRVVVPSFKKEPEPISSAQKLEELMTKTVPLAEKVPFSALSEKKPVPPEQTMPAVPKSFQQPTPKIPPIDLRQIKPAAEPKPVGTPPEAAPTVYPTKSVLPKPSEKKTPYTGTDPYKEPVE